MDAPLGKPQEVNLGTEYVLNKQQYHFFHSVGPNVRNVAFYKKLK